MLFFTFFPICLFLPVTTASLTFYRTGWLDRVVQYYSHNFTEEFKKLPLVPIKATLEPRYPGYVDSPEWNFTSVVWLLTLLSESPETRQVRRAIRRSLQSNRRFMSVKDSYKMFPSLKKIIPNDIYYDETYEVQNAPTDAPANFCDDDAIIYIGNPVEARLPSAKISVKLLREILENRANAARYMPSTFKELYTWDAFTSKSKGGGAGVEEATKAGTGETGGTGSADGGGTEAATEAPNT